MLSLVKFFVASIFFCFSLFSLSHAAVFSVTVTEDVHDGVCDAHCSLRDAVSAANALPGKDEVHLPFDAIISGGESTTEDDDTNMYDDLDVLDDLILRGNGSEVYWLGRGFMEVINTSLEIQNLILADIRGGALLIRDGDLTVNNVTFTNNCATYGSSIYGEGGKWQINSSRFEHNHSDCGVEPSHSLSLTAGTVAGYGVDLNIYNSTFIYNRSGYGAAAASGYYGRLAVSDSVFVGNTSTATSFSSGALSGFFLDSFEVNNGHFIENTATRASWEGGASAIFLWYNFEGHIVDSTFYGNVSLEDFGAIHCSGVTSACNLRIDRSSFSFNQGGTIVLPAWSSYPLAVISDSTFSHNTTASSGAAIRSSSMVHLSFSTLMENSAAVSGGAVSVAHLFVENTIIANNSAPTAPDCIATGQSASSFIHDRSGCELISYDDFSSDIDPMIGSFHDTLSGDGLYWLYFLADDERIPPIPLFAFFEELGTPLGHSHYPLLDGSPLIDAVTCTTSPYGFDQLGNPRPVVTKATSVTHCDVGAVEFVPDMTGDEDMDGVGDALDACPATAMGKMVDGFGCSDHQVDSDHDGICSVGAPSSGPSGCVNIDHCPTENATGYDVDQNGCIDNISGLLEMIHQLAGAGMIDPAIVGSLLEEVETAKRLADQELFCLAIQVLDDFQYQINVQTSQSMLTSEAAGSLDGYAESVKQQLQTLVVGGCNE